MNFFNRNFVCAAMIALLAATSASAAQSGYYRDNNRGYYDDGAVGERRPGYNNDYRSDYREQRNDEYGRNMSYDDALRRFSNDEPRSRYGGANPYQRDDGYRRRGYDEYDGRAHYAPDSDTMMSIDGHQPARHMHGAYYHEDDRENRTPPYEKSVYGGDNDDGYYHVHADSIEEYRRRYAMCAQHGEEHCPDHHTPHCPTHHAVHCIEHHESHCPMHHEAHCHEHHAVDCGCDGWPSNAWKNRTSEDRVNVWGGSYSEHRSQLARDWEDTYSELLPVKISNSTNRDLSIALVYYDKSVNDWVCRGWVNVPRHGEASFGINHLRGKKLYYYVEHKGTHYSPKNSDGMDLSVTSGNFSYRQRDSRNSILNLNSPYIAHFTAANAPTDGMWLLNITR